MSSLGFSSFVFSLFGFEHYHHISCFCGMLKTFIDSLVSFMSPYFVWAPLIIEDFLCFSHLPSSVGCDPNQSYFSRKMH
jgi:hypothetical protein